MKRFTYLLLILLFVGMAHAADTTATLAPAVRVQFSLPLSDGSTATAIFLPGANGQTLLVYVTGGKLVTGTLVLDGDVTPIPVPPPPVPPPTPVENIWGLVIIHETGTDTPEQGRIVASKSIDEYCSSKKWKKWTPDKDVVDENNKPVIAAYVARAKTLPYFFIVDEKGAVVQEGSLPSESNLLSILQKIGGEK